MPSDPSVREKGLEPLRLTAAAPKAAVSAIPPLAPKTIYSRTLKVVIETTRMMVPFIRAQPSH